LIQGELGSGPWGGQATKRKKRTEDFQAYDEGSIPFTRSPFETRKSRLISSISAGASGFGILGFQISSGHLVWSIRRATAAATFLGR